MTKTQHTLVLLHGGAMSGTAFRPVAERLTHIRCLTPDLRGHGINRSIPFSSLAHCADDIASFLARETDEPVHFFGLSLGGYVALNLLAAAKIPIASAIISGVPLNGMRGKWAIARVIDLVYPLLGLKGVREMTGRLAGIEDCRLMSDAEGRGWAHPSTVRDLAQAILRSDPMDLVKRSTARSLFLAGTDEPSSVGLGLKQIPALCAEANAGLVMGGGHGWCLNNPDLAAKVIENWIHNEPLPPDIQLIGTSHNRP